MAKDYGTIIYRKETRSYVVGKLCVPHPDDDNVPDEVRRQFSALWADVDAYAKAHPDMVTEEHAYVPPVPTVEELAARVVPSVIDASPQQITLSCRTIRFHKTSLKISRCIGKRSAICRNSRGSRGVGRMILPVRGLFFDEINKGGCMNIPLSDTATVESLSVSDVITIMKDNGRNDYHVL